MPDCVRFWMLAAALMTALMGCSDNTRGPLRIATSQWPGYEPLFLARSLGYFDDSNVRLTELPSANISMEAFRNHSTDLATLTLDETLTLLSEGRKLRILFAMDISNGADAMVARPEIKSLAEIKGKRIAIENIPLGVYMLARMLETANLTSADVTVLPMTEDTHEKHYRQGKIDAAITFDPFKTHLQKAGAHVLFDSSQIPNEIFDLMLVDEDVYNTRRVELCDLTRQWYRALDYLRMNPDDAAARMGPRLDVDGKTFLAMMSGLVVPSREDNAKLLGGAEPALLAPAQRLAQIMEREHMLADTADVASAIDPDFQQCH